MKRDENLKVSRKYSSDLNFEHIFSINHFLFPVLFDGSNRYLEPNLEHLVIKNKIHFEQSKSSERFFFIHYSFSFNFSIFSIISSGISTCFRLSRPISSSVLMMISTTSSHALRTFLSPSEEFSNL